MQNNMNEEEEEEVVVVLIWINFFLYISFDEIANWGMGVIKH